MNPSRRSFCKGLGLGFGASLLPISRLAFSNIAEEPHFFLQVVLPGGMDATYTFDARPLAMTRAKLLQNYLGDEPIRLTGANGQATWRTRLVDPIMKFHDRFSIINGVIMVPEFDGHPNNVSFLMTGNAFGGEGQLPHLNESGSRKPLDYVQVGAGSLLTELSNTGGSVPLSTAGMMNLQKRIDQFPDLRANNSPLLKHIKRRIAANMHGIGLFSAGSWAMHKAFYQMPTLTRALSKVNIDTTATNETRQNIAIIGEMFKANVCKAGLYVFNTDLNPEQNLDCHDGESAKKMPEVISKLMNDLAVIFDYLSDTPFDDKQSLFDVTTVAVSTEFSRTMRQSGRKIDETGTDHNPLTNTILLAGKGIRPKCVFGASDFQSESETLSKAHLSFDPTKTRIMGRPFDFSSEKTRNDLPEKYKEEDYILYSSVANTIYELFDVEDSHYRTLGRNQPAAPIIKSVLG